MRAKWGVRNIADGSCRSSPISPRQPARAMPSSLPGSYCCFTTAPRSPHEWTTIAVARRSRLAPGWLRCSRLQPRLGDRDDALPPSAAPLQVPEGGRNFIQGIEPVDDRRKVARFDERIQECHIFLLEWSPPPHHRHLLASSHRDQRSEKRTLEQQGRGSTKHHVKSPGAQRPPPIQHRTTGHDVEDQVVPPPFSDRVLPGGVDYVVCPDRAHHVHLSRAVHAGHFRSEVLSDLHREGTHVSTRTVDHHPVSWLDLAFAAKSLQSQNR